MFRKKKPDTIWKITDIHKSSSWYTARQHLINHRLQGAKRRVGQTPILEGTVLDGQLAGQRIYIYGCEAKAVKHLGQIVCECNAYLFPHRALGGKCTASELFDLATESGMCPGCEHQVVQYQHHPYGMGTAAEDISYCGLEANDPEQWLQECPALEPRRKK